MHLIRMPAWALVVGDEIRPDADDEIFVPVVENEDDGDTCWIRLASGEERSYLRGRVCDVVPCRPVGFSRPAVDPWAVLAVIGWWFDRWHAGEISDQTALDWIGDSGLGAADLLDRRNVWAALPPEIRAALSGSPPVEVSGQLVADAVADGLAPCPGCAAIPDPERPEVLSIDRERGVCAMCDEPAAPSVVPSPADLGVHLPDDPVAAAVEVMRMIENARDVHADEGAYPDWPHGPREGEQGFDDWAADLSAVALSRLGLPAGGGS